MLKSFLSSVVMFNTPCVTSFYPPASEASREVENFDWRKKHTPTRIWCQRIRDSVCHGIRPKLSQDWHF